MMAEGAGSPALLRTRVTSQGQWGQWVENPSPQQYHRVDIQINGQVKKLHSPKQLLSSFLRD